MIEFNEDRFFAHAADLHATPSRVLDDLEPETAPADYRQGYRDAARKFLFVLNHAMAAVVEAQNPRTAAYQVSFAVGAGVCAGRSMSEVAAALGVSRACLSKGAKSFIRATGIGGSSYMKSEEATPAYRAARIKSINRNNPKDQ